MNWDSCVNDGYCLRHFSVDTAPSTYFSPFPNRTLPRSTRTMTDSGQLRSSISLPGYHVDFFTFAEHVSFEHSTGSPWPVIYSGREGNINKQTYKTQKFQVHTRSSIRQSASLCSGAPRPVRDLALAPRLSVATEVPVPVPSSHPVRCRKLLAMCYLCWFSPFPTRGNNVSPGKLPQISQQLETFRQYKSTNFLKENFVNSLLSGS